MGRRIYRLPSNCLATVREDGMAAFSLHGDLVWTEEIGAFRTLEDGYLIVEDGRIKGISKHRPDMDIIDMAGRLVIPGLSDLHLHAPQYSFAGLYMDEELLEWLDRHTFPEEAKFSSLEYADKAYTLFAEDLLSSATTRFSAFGTIHVDATLLLMRKLEEAGLSGYAGKVNMDRNSPPFLSETEEDSVSGTRRFIDAASSFTLVRPIITPRFIPSCTDGLLERLGVMAAEGGIPVQSHLDENLSEIEWVRSLCPWVSSYAAAYDRFGLLGTTPTIMAHSVWLGDDEMDLLRKRGVFVAHSPSSNTNLSSGIAPVRKMLERGINVGLATDVAGGSSLSMLRMVCEAVAASKLRWRLIDEEDRPISFPEAFYLASKGGGAFFGRTGSFEPGYDADIVVLDDCGCRTPLRAGLGPAERLELYAYRHPDDPVKAKFVKGRRVL